MFDFDKITNFDEHINLSIPNYEDLISHIVKYSEYFIEEDSNVYDLGCSTGTLIKKYKNFKNANYTGIDNSSLIPENDDRFKKVDIDKYEQFDNASFITSIFTLQFLNSRTRAKLIGRIKNALNQNGALIICEKIYSLNSKLQDITNSLYYEYKEQFFSCEDILKKERDLRSNMRIKDYRFLIDELSEIGIPEIFWKSYNFIGLIVVKK